MIVKNQDVSREFLYLSIGILEKILKKEKVVFGDEIIYLFTGQFVQLPVTKIFNFLGLFSKH